MKRTRILLLIALLTAACMGLAARKHVLLPAMGQAWPSIEKHAERGITAAQMSPPAEAVVRVAMARMVEMLSSGDIDMATQIRWDLIKAVALIGIDDMLKIGPGVAESLRESVRMFDLQFQKLTSR